LLRHNSPASRARGRSHIDALEPRVLLSAVPAPDHIVVVIEENHSYEDVIGNPEMPYINTLAQQGASFTSAYSLFHPSQPNYLAIFSGSNQEVYDNLQYDFFGVPNLASQLIAAGKTFVGYAEDLPEVGSTVWTMGKYDRRHNPWVDFDNVPPTSNRPFSDFPTDYSSLPTVSFVVPNEDHNSHDGPPADADQWLKANLDGYVQWAKTHNSLLIVTWDEGQLVPPFSQRIATIFYGANVQPGAFSAGITHYNILRTIEDFYGLTPLANAAGALPIDYGHRLAPPDMISTSDSGFDPSDDITNAWTPTFIGLAPPGAPVKILSDGVEVGSGVGDNAGAYSITVGLLPEGVHEIQAIEDIPGFLADRSDPLTVTIDRTGPKVTQVQFNGHPSSANIRRLGINFDEVVAVALPQLILHNDSTGKNVNVFKMSLIYNPQNHQAAWYFPGLPWGMLENGNYTATLSAAVADLAGNPLDGNGDGISGDAKIFRFFQLMGDANADRVIDQADFKMLYASFGVVASDASADFNGDGKVAFSDFQILELSFGQALPLAAPEEQAPVSRVKSVLKSAPVPVRPPPFAKKRLSRA
jgi:hypothetical protein